VSKFKLLHSVLLLLSFIAVAFAYYWSFRFWVASNSPGSNELLAGEALTILYSASIWIGVILIAVIGKKHLSKTMVLMSFLPAVLMFIPTMVRVLSNGL
jgi:hypothetical protein